ncbi:hypothetical protein ACLVWQ_22110 [Streptomyces sp. CWNU-52B]|uniref:hypothetical protein n=1 Tax=unclassified Streptomyces TaxID=2593676 RepID=UPI0039C4B112
MAVEQLPGQVREFAQYLSGLLSRLDQGGGWCGVFWQRDPDGMRACLDGWEVPPWDVVEAILQDLAAEYGERAAAQETERARTLHGASLTAYDGRSGGRDALGDRLDVMLREQRYAAERLTELGRALPEATTQQETDSLRLDLAWARDDHDRATARCAEIRSRIDELDRRTAGGHAQEALAMPPVDDGAGPFWIDEPVGEPADGPVHEPIHEPRRGGDGGADRARPASDEDDWPDLWRDASADRAARRNTAPDPDPDGQDPASPHGSAAAPSDTAPPEQHEPPEPPAPKQRFRRRIRGGARGSARFAGLPDAEDDTGAVVVPPVPAPQPAEGAPRGARFAGGAEDGDGSGPRREPLDDEARRTTVETVRKLVRLRSEGRTGEAHAVLVEAAYWPAAGFPLLAAELHRAGLGADWATLLWEVVSLPADRLVAAAEALVAAGRTADGEQMLRQGVVRPAPEIGEAVLGLVEEGRHREVRALVDAYVRVRSPEEAVRSIDANPQLLAPILLEAAREVSEQRYWDLIHALRVAGYTA